MTNEEKNLFAAEHQNISKKTGLRTETVRNHTEGMEDAWRAESENEKKNPAAGLAIWNALSEEEICRRWQEMKSTSSQDGLAELELSTLPEAPGEGGGSEVVAEPETCAVDNPVAVFSEKEAGSRGTRPVSEGWKRVRRNHRKIAACVVLTALMAGGVSSALALDHVYGQKLARLEQQVTVLQSQNAGKGQGLATVGLFAPDNEKTSLRSIVTGVSPSVVGIKITVPPTRNTRGGFVWQSAGEEVSGSGFIMNYEGYIATNYHVVSASVENPDALIEVSLADGRIAEGTYIAGDEQTDLAVVRIDPEDITPVTLGNSDELLPGDTAIAIGNPLGETFYGSVTAGIISGIDRQIGQENTFDSLIQTDAAINPGNSGGPLLNARGEVIGINTVKIATTGVEGLGFAIPINAAYPILQSLIDYGYVKDRPGMGVSSSEISSLASAFYHVPAGLLVQSVEAGGSADVAGIRRNDIILTVDGEAVTTDYALRQALQKHQVGDTVEVTFYRSGQTLTAELTLQEEHTQLG